MVKLLIIACYEKIGIFILGSGSCTNILATCIIYNAADHFTYMHGIKHTTICHILYNLNIFMETRHICTTKISCVILITPMKSQGFTNMRKRWTRKGTIFSAKKMDATFPSSPYLILPTRKVNLRVVFLDAHSFRICSIHTPMSAHIAVDWKFSSR